MKFRPVSPRRVELRAFTLIELLVVISIIMILMAFMMPALGGARDAARSAKCMANLKQYSAAATAYVTNNAMFLPVIVDAESNGLYNVTHYASIAGIGGQQSGKFRCYMDQMMPYFANVRPDVQYTNVSGRPVQASPAVEVAGRFVSDIIEVELCPNLEQARRVDTGDSTGFFYRDRNPGDPWIAPVFYRDTSYHYNYRLAATRPTIGGGPATLVLPATSTSIQNWRSSSFGISSNASTPAQELPVFPFLGWPRLDDVKEPSKTILMGDSSTKYADYIQLVPPTGILGSSNVGWHGLSLTNWNRLFIDGHAETIHKSMSSKLSPGPPFKMITDVKYFNLVAK